MIISFTNQKGGVAKTTSSLTVAHWFALQGKRVLVVDLDGQGHASTGLRMGKSNSLYRLIVEEQPLHKVAVEALPNLHLIGNDHTGELVKGFIQQANFKEYILSNVLADADYDLIVLDTPPSTDVLHILALVASDLLVVPTSMDYFSLDGVGYVLKTLRTLDRYPGVTAPALVGVLPTMFDRTTNETMQNVQALQQMLGPDKILPPIPRDTKVREASSHGQTVWQYAPRCPAAIGFSQKAARQKNSAGNVGGYLHICEIIAELL
jgi:chromosome partitioning protein